MNTQHFFSNETMSCSTPRRLVVAVGHGHKHTDAAFEEALSRSSPQGVFFSFRFADGKVLNSTLSHR
jgi:hypothetical protein